MVMAKVDKTTNTIETVGLPPVGTLKDGRSVSNYNLLPVGTLNDEGWLEVEDVKPTYDENTHELEHRGLKYDSANNKVTTDYLVKEKPAPPPPPPDYDKLFKDAVNAATTLNELKAALTGLSGPGAQPKRGQ